MLVHVIGHDPEISSGLAISRGSDDSPTVQFLLILSSVLSDSFILRLPEEARWLPATPNLIHIG